MTGYNYADGTANDQFGLVFQSGALSQRLDAFGRPRQGTTGAPVVAIGAGAGAGATITAHTGTDSHGNVQIHTAGSPAANSPVVTVTFAQPFVGTNPPVVQIEPKDAGAANLYYASCTNTVLTISCATAPTTGTNYAFDYFVVGGA
jgi:hypothetical protein